MDEPMREQAAVVALVGASSGDWYQTADVIAEARSAVRLLDGEPPIMSTERKQRARDLTSRVTPSDVSRAQALIERVKSQGVRLITVLDEDYPENLKLIFNRPPFKHPLETAVTRVGALASLYAPLLVRGPAHVDHNRADDRAFSVACRLHGERVLVLDDTLTTGARLQSAVSALRLNGASAAAGVAVGRVIDPDWNGNCRRIWDQARETQFSFDQCCLCRDLSGAKGT
jgi:hypothetical protein